MQSWRHRIALFCRGSKLKKSRCILLHDLVKTQILFRWVGYNGHEKLVTCRLKHSMPTILVAWAFECFYVFSYCVLTVNWGLMHNAIDLSKNAAVVLTIKRLSIVWRPLKQNMQINRFFRDWLNKLDFCVTHHVSKAGSVHTIKWSWHFKILNFIQMPHL